MTATFILQELLVRCKSGKSIVPAAILQDRRRAVCRREIYFWVCGSTHEASRRQTKIHPFGNRELLIQSKYDLVCLCFTYSGGTIFKKLNELQRGVLYDFYLNHIDYINNWDL